MANKKDQVSPDVLEQGYWLYADGYSYWGTSLYRGKESPLKITTDMHGNQIVDKVGFHTKEMARLSEEKRLAEEKEKAKEKKQ